MSQENVDVLMRFGTEFNERGWEALRDFADPDIEFHEPPEQPGGRERSAAWTPSWGLSIAGRRRGSDRARRLSA